MAEILGIVVGALLLAAAGGAIAYGYELRDARRLRTRDEARLGTEEVSPRATAAAPWVEQRFGDERSPGGPSGEELLRLWAEFIAGHDWPRKESEVAVLFRAMLRGERPREEMYANERLDISCTAPPAAREPNPDDIRESLVPALVTVRPA